MQRYNLYISIDNLVTVRVCAFVCESMRLCVCVFAFVNVSVRLSTNLCVGLRVYAFVCVFVRFPANLCVCVHVRAFVCVLFMFVI